MLILRSFYFVFGLVLILRDLGQIQHEKQTLHYAAIESNRELNKSLKVIASLLLIFGPNLIKKIFYWCRTVNIFQEKYLFRKNDKKKAFFDKKPEGLDC